MDYDFETHTMDKETNSMIRDDYSVFESTPFLWNMSCTGALHHEVNDKDGIAGFKEEMMNPNISVRAPDMVAMDQTGRFWGGWFWTKHWLHLQCGAPSR